MHSLQKVVIRLLRQSERYTKTDMVYASKSGAWLTLSHGANTLLGVVRSIAFANLLPVYVYGVYKYVTAAADLLGGFSLTGLPAALTRQVAKGEHGLLRYAARLMLYSHAPFTLLSLSMAGYYFYFGNTQLGIAFMVTALVQPLINTTAITAAYLTGKKDFRQAAVITAVQNIVLTIATVGVLFISDSASLVVAVTLGAPLIASAIQYWRLASHRSERTLRVSGELRRYSTELSLMGIVVAIADQIDKLLVFHFMGPAELAVYSFATLMPTHLKGLLKNLQPMLLPRYSQRSIAEVKGGLWSKTWRLSIGIGVLVMAYIVVAPLLFTYLFPAYTNATAYSQVYALSLFGFVALFPNTGLIALKRTRALLWGRVASAVIQIGTLFIGIYLFGLWGAILSRVALKYIDAAIYFTAFGIASRNRP